MRQSSVGMVRSVTTYYSQGPYIIDIEPLLSVHEHNVLVQDVTLACEEPILPGQRVRITLEVLT